MNDERPIEKLLRRYAKKRRDDAGAPVELHPATRRMLQGEVARRFSKRAAVRKGEATTFAQVLKLWRRQLIWALPVLIVLGVGVWMLVGPGEKPGSEFDLAKNTSAPAAPAEMVGSSLKALETPPPAVAPVTTTSLGHQTTLAYAEGSPARDGLQSSGVPAERHEDKSGVAMDRDASRRNHGDATIVKGSPGILDKETGRATENYFAEVSPSDESRNQPTVAKRALGGKAGSVSDEKTQTMGVALSSSVKADSLGDFQSVRKDYVSADDGRLARASANKPAAFAPEASAKYFRQEAHGGRQNNIQANSQAFANRAPASSYGKTAKAGEIVPVLANFQVEQAGNQLRVIDGDGSTYLGEVESQAAAQSVIVASEIKGAERLKLKQEDKLAVSRLGGTLLSGQEAAQNFAYRVAGTNRTLNRQVVFAWNFVPLTNELAAAQIKASGRGGNVLQNNLPVQQFPLLLNNSFINGRAQMSGAKEIEINAVPVTP
jgi:hypothetical protein